MCQENVDFATITSKICSGTALERHLGINRNLSEHNSVINSAIRRYAYDKK